VFDFNKKYTEENAMKKLMKKGQVVNNLQVFIMAVVTIAVILAVGLFVLQEVQGATKDGATATAASNATGDIITKLASAPTWIGILIVVVFASAILAYFYMR
jgi:uncharacterized protein (UPF0333 family)